MSYYKIIKDKSNNTKVKAAAWNGLAKCRHIKEEYVEEERCINQALSLEPTNKIFIESKISCLESLGRTEEAQKLKSQTLT